jgi:hypothetical protein
MKYSLPSSQIAIQGMANVMELPVVALTATDSLVKGHQTLFCR